MILGPPPEHPVCWQIDPKAEPPAKDPAAGAHYFFGAPPDGAIDWVIGSQLPASAAARPSAVFSALPGQGPPLWTVDSELLPSTDKLREHLHPILGIPPSGTVRWEFRPDHVQVEHPALLIEWHRERRVRDGASRAAGSLAFHALLLLAVAQVPVGYHLVADAPEIVISARQVTPLVSPPAIFTQPEPNHGRVGTSFDLQSLMAPPSPSPGPPRRSSGAPEEAVNQAREFAPTPEPVKPTPPQIVEPPKIQQSPVNVARNLPPAAGDLLSPAQLQPAPPPKEKPKLAFEDVGVPGAELGTGGLGAVTRPSRPTSSPSELARNKPVPSSGGLVVGGEDNENSGGIADILNPQRRRADVGSSLEMMSDPKGLDFRPYLIRILSAVRKNWLAVLPESARMGMPGRVVLQFAISRNGDVPKLVIAIPSGSLPLDRAAVAGVSASDPFPPLPPEYVGEQIRLQMVFSYNMPKQ